MKNHLLILFVLAVTLSACKKDEGGTQPVDLLNTPLSSTTMGFSGTINNTAFYATDSLDIRSDISPIDSNNDFYASFLFGVKTKTVPSMFFIQLYFLKSATLTVTDSAFFNYIKTGNYNLIESNEFPGFDSSTNSIEIYSSLGTYPDGYSAQFGTNPAPENYFTVLDTLHTTYQGKAAVKFRAKIKCTLYTSSLYDQISLPDGVIVGLFVKP